MLRVVPKAFVDIDVEKNYERNVIYVRCRRTRRLRIITYEEIMEAPSIPPKDMPGFVLWLRHNFFDKIIYLVKK